MKITPITKFETSVERLPDGADGGCLGVGEDQLGTFDAW